jgi:hypothetical protein
MVRFLVEHGAEPGVKDPVWSATPLAWARQFSREDVAEYLRGLEDQP